MSQNSGSEQCPESKLGWVHRVHTLGSSCAHTAPRPGAQRALGAMSWCTGRRIAGHALPCRGRVTARTCALALRVTALLPLPPITIQNCFATQSIPCAHRAPYRIAGHVAVLYHSPAALCCDTTIAPQPQYNFCIATTPNQAMRARCRTPRAQAGRIMACLNRIVAHARPYRGRVLAVSWPLQLRPSQLSHDTVCCIVTQHKL